MRFLSKLLFVAALFVVAAAAPFAFGHSTRSTHIVNSDGDETEIHIVRTDDGEHWASFRRDGVRSVTTDPSVLADIEKAMEKQRQISEEHSRLGRRHSELGREHSELGREHSRLGREHSRLGREASREGMTSDLERRQRELEDEQRKLEDKQRKLEDRQRDLEGEQRKLEDRQGVAEREANRAIERIFDRAVRDGKAKRK